MTLTSDEVIVTRNFTIGTGGLYTLVARDSDSTDGLKVRKLFYWIVATQAIYSEVLND